MNGRLELEKAIKQPAMPMSHHAIGLSDYQRAQIVEKVAGMLDELQQIEGDSSEEGLRRRQDLSQSLHSLGIKLWRDPTRQPVTY